MTADPDRRGGDRGRWARAFCTIALLLSVGGGPASAGAPDLNIALAARAMTPGELVVVTMTFAAEPSGVLVSAFDHRIPAFDAGNGVWKALVGIDLDQAPGHYLIAVDARVGSAAVRHTHPLVVAPKAFATRTLRVSPDFVNPPASLTARIARETKLVSEAYATSAPERLWHVPFARPVRHVANSRFGQRSVFNGQERNRHGGTDFASPAGTPVKAPNAGRVVLAENLFYSGNTAIIDHGLGVVSMLAHLSRIDVRPGETVSVGQVIGLAGATGRVTGPHLHWGMRVFGARVDPLGALHLLGEPKANPKSKTRQPGR